MVVRGRLLYVVAMLSDCIVIVAQPVLLMPRGVEAGQGSICYMIWPLIGA